MLYTYLINENYSGCLLVDIECHLENTENQSSLKAQKTGKMWIYGRSV